MKIKLSVSDESYEEVRQFLTEKGIELDDEAEFVLVQRDKFISHLAVREPDSGKRVHLSADEIVCIESYGHAVEVYTDSEVYATSDRLYQLCSVLDPERFLRVNKSVIVAKNRIRRIKPALSMRFTLIMSNGRRVDVTRSYYNSFKEAFSL